MGSNASGLRQLDAEGTARVPVGLGATSRWLQRPAGCGTRVCSSSEIHRELNEDPGHRDVPDPQQRETWCVARAAALATAMITMRAADVTRDGIVLPIAWNMLELTKIMPDADEVPRDDVEVLLAHGDHGGIGREDPHHAHRRPTRRRSPARTSPPPAIIAAIRNVCARAPPVRRRSSDRRPGPPRSRARRRAGSTPA